MLMPLLVAIIVQSLTLYEKSNKNTEILPVFLLILTPVVLFPWTESTFCIRFQTGTKCPIFQERSPIIP